MSLVVSPRTLTQAVLSLLIVPAGFAIGSAQATTFYVRADGGDAAQCNGRADAPIRAAAPPRPAPGRTQHRPAQFRHRAHRRWRHADDRRRYLPGRQRRLHAEGPQRSQHHREDPHPRQVRHDPEAGGHRRHAPRDQPRRQLQRRNRQPRDHRQQRLRLQPLQLRGDAAPARCRGRASASTPPPRTTCGCTT